MSIARATMGAAACADENGGAVTGFSPPRVQWSATADYFTV
jgi:hypothetical protein